VVFQFVIPQDNGRERQLWQVADPSELPQWRNARLSPREMPGFN